MIYYELERRNEKAMSGVLIKGSFGAVILYALVGIFGYLTFAYDPDSLSTKNILDAPYNKNVAILIVSVIMTEIILGKFCLILLSFICRSIVCSPCKRYS